MRVKILQGVSISGVHHEPGQIADLSNFDALALIGSGRAVEEAAPVPAAPVAPAPKSAPKVSAASTPAKDSKDSGKDSKKTEK